MSCACTPQRLRACAGCSARSGRRLRPPERARRAAGRQPMLRKAGGGGCRGGPHPLRPGVPPRRPLRAAGTPPRRPCAACAPRTSRATCRQAPGERAGPGQPASAGKRGTGRPVEAVPAAAAGQGGALLHWPSRALRTAAGGVAGRLFGRRGRARGSWWRPRTARPPRRAPCTGRAPTAAPPAACMRSAWACTCPAARPPLGAAACARERGRGAAFAWTGHHAPLLAMSRMHGQARRRCTGCTPMEALGAGAARAFASWRRDKVNSWSSASPAPTLTASMSGSPTKLHVLVMARLSGCCVTSMCGVMQKTRRYLPRHECLVHMKRATQSGGVCGSWLRRSCIRWSIAAMADCLRAHLQTLCPLC